MLGNSAGVNELHVVNRRRGHFSRRLSAGEMFGNERGHRAAQGIVDTAGAAGGYGLTCFCLRERQMALGIAATSIRKMRKEKYLDYVNDGQHPLVLTH